MERFPELHHDKVGDVDDVVDRADADGFQTVLEPLRTLPDRDAPDDARRVFRAEILRFDCDKTAPVLKSLRRRQTHVREGTPSAAERRNVARNAPVGKPVRTVRCDLHRINGVLFNQIVERCAGNIVRGQDHQPAVLIADSELAFAAHHAERLDAPQSAFADNEVLPPFRIRKNRADGRQRNHIARVAVRSAADDLKDVPASRIDLADGQMVGIRVFFAADDFCDNYAGGNHAAGCDLFHFKSRHRQRVRQFLGRRLQFDIIFQPVQ